MDLEYDENPGTPMEIPKIPLKSQESHENPENPGRTIEIPKILWKSQKSREYEIRRFPLEYKSWIFGFVIAFGL